MTASRYVAHAVALVIVVVIASSATHHVGSGGFRLGSVNAEGQLVSEGGQAGNLTLGRLGTVVQPVTAPTVASIPHKPIPYKVQQGEDLKGIATEYQLTPDQIHWSNPGMGDQVSPGDVLMLPPIAGVVVKVGKDDTLPTLATRYHADAKEIQDFNYLVDSSVQVGTTLVIPNGQGDDLHPAPPGRSSSGWVPTIPSVPSVPSVPYAPGSATTAGFPNGYCTRYVADHRAGAGRPVTWRGNANQWLSAAASQGVPTGSTPKAGSIMVTNESGFGHVAYVEGVNGDGSWNVTEMNFRGFGVISSRTIRPGQVPLQGFIYW